MDNEKYENGLRSAFAVAIFFLILAIIIFVASFFTGKLTPILLISYIIQIVLLITTAVGIKQKALYGPICGIIVSILMIMAFNLIDTIIGVCYLIDNINIIRHMQSNIKSEL